MTIDDLVKVYERHGVKVSRPDLVAVVEALREVICDNVYMMQECCGMGRTSRDGLREECCGNPVHSITRGNLINSFNEILASDGEEAGTHGSPELDEDARKLEAMGQDAGPTVQDLFPEAFAPAADTIPCPTCKGDGCTPQLDRRGNVYPEPCQRCETTGLIPAPAADLVCVWTDAGEAYDTTCAPPDEVVTTEKFKFCPSCGKPISFKSEAAR